MNDLTKRIRDQIVASDHIHGCPGRRYYCCDCGYDSRTELSLLEEASRRIAELEACLAEIIRMNPMRGRLELPQTKLARAILPEEGETSYPDPQDRWEGWPEPPLQAKGER